MVVAVNAPVDVEPEVARVPLQPPDAVHAVALVDDQLSVAEPLLATLAGLADNVTVGTGGAVTAIVADALALPPGPVQVSV